MNNKVHQVHKHLHANLDANLNANTLMQTPLLKLTLRLVRCLAGVVLVFLLGLSWQVLQARVYKQSKSCFQLV